MIFDMIAAVIMCTILLVAILWAFPAEVNTKKQK